MKLLLLVLFFQACFASSFLKPVQLTPQKSSQNGKQPEIDMCPFCVNFFGQTINELLEIILNTGVLGSCGALCSQLPNQVEQVGCQLICDYVGISGFIDLIEYEDPDPIYLCQVIDFCNVVNGGSVKVQGAVITPSSGPQGTTFTLGIQYTVINATGPGYISLLVTPPSSDGGQPFGTAQFTSGQAPGPYGIGWQLQTQPSENEPFSPGSYGVQLAVCEGDCTNNHPYGGVYGFANGAFVITEEKNR